MRFIALNSPDLAHIIDYAAALYTVHALAIIATTKQVTKHTNTVRGN